MFTLFFTNQSVNNFADAKTCDTELFGRYFRAMLDKGIYLAPSQFEAMFISTAIGNSEIERIIAAHTETLAQL